MLAESLFFFFFWSSLGSVLVKKTRHLLSLLLILEILVLLVLEMASCSEVTVGFIPLILVMGAAEGALGLGLLVKCSRSTGKDRASLGGLMWTAPGSL